MVPPLVGRHLPTRSSIRLITIARHTKIEPARVESYHACAHEARSRLIPQLPLEASHAGSAPETGTRFTRIARVCEMATTRSATPFGQRRSTSCNTRGGHCGAGTAPGSERRIGGRSRENTLVGAHRDHRSHAPAGRRRGTRDTEPERWPTPSKRRMPARRPSRRSPCHNRGNGAPCQQAACFVSLPHSRSGLVPGARSKYGDYTPKTNIWQCFS